MKSHYICKNIFFLNFIYHICKFEKKKYPRITLKNVYVTNINFKNQNDQNISGKYTFIPLVLNNLNFRV